MSHYCFIINQNPFNHRFERNCRSRFVLSRPAAVNHQPPDAVGRFPPQRPTNSRNCCDFL